MGFWEWMGFENPRDSPKTEQPKEGLPKVTDNVRDSGQTFVFGRSNAGEQVDEKAAMQIPTVYACVRLLAESIAALPLHLYRVTDDNGNKEKARDHPLYKILYRQPNPEMTSFVFWETLMTHLLLWGNAYAQIVRDGKNTVLGLYPLMPENVEVDRDESGELYYYKGSITVKIDAIAASAASVVAMAGDTVQMSPVAMLMIHDPSTVAMGNTKDMEKAIEVLTEVKESIINAYAAKSGLSHARIANLMSNETWMNAKKAVELGFADEILFAKKEEEPDSDPADPENPEEAPDSEPGEGGEEKPFQKDTAGHLFSSRQMDLIVLNRLGVKPEDVGQKHTEPKEPPADPKPSAEPTPQVEPPANPGPVLDMDGKTEDGSIPYNILMKQLECMK